MYCDGVPWLRVHDLRHTTWVKWHVPADTPLPVLKELGGWATLTMVERHAHLGSSQVLAWVTNIVDHGVNLEQAAEPEMKKGLDRSKPLIHTENWGG